MSLWQFSESSEPLLKQCIELSASDNNNKWIQKFGRKSECINKNSEVSDQNTVIHDGLEPMEIVEEPIHKPIQVKVERAEILNLEPVTHFEDIVKKCLENANLYLILANEWSVASIEQLCKYVFTTENINSTFLENFYINFFPAFFKRDLTRLSVDLLVMGKCYAVLQKRLILIILRDTDLPSRILHSYVSTLNVIEVTDFLASLYSCHIPKEAFIYHLAAIHDAYKNSQKSKELQHYILAKLKETSEDCVVDKNYGRFLLNFLQNHKEFKTNITEIENIVESHRSAFRKPCLNALNMIKMKGS